MEVKLNEIKTIKTSDLIQDDRNLNKGTERGRELIQSSVTKFGAGRSILIDKNNRIIAGNKTQEAALVEGINDVLVVETDGKKLVAVKRTDIDLDTKEGREMALADNATVKVDLQWDTEQMESIADDFGIDMEEWGMDEELFWNDDENLNVEEDDFNPEDIVETKVKKGEIWVLGIHRLMCGDSTTPRDIMRLLAKETPNLIYTDPPYGMNAVSNSGVLKEKYKTDIHGDDDNTIAQSAFKLCQAAFPNARQVWWGANYYTECLPSSECWLVWDKNNGMSDQTDCELAWANFRSVVRQFTMASEKTNRIHPTQKPCKLFADIVERMHKNETYNKVLDLFGGSGSTMIACEQMGIQTYTMEYDPHYCDVIIARWEKLTGNKAELEK